MTTLCGAVGATDSEHTHGRTIWDRNPELEFRVLIEPFHSVKKPLHLRPRLSNRAPA
jgi:hypothetical protein